MPLHILSLSKFNLFLHREGTLEDILEIEKMRVQYKQMLEKELWDLHEKFENPKERKQPSSQVSV